MQDCTLPNFIMDTRSLSTLADNFTDLDKVPAIYTDAILQNELIESIKGNPDLRERFRLNCMRVFEEWNKDQITTAQEVVKRCLAIWNKLFGSYYTDLINMESLNFANLILMQIDTKDWVEENTTNISVEEVEVTEYV